MTAATATQKPKNLRVKHEGMGWPAGEVIPARALPRDGADHVALGAVEPTDHPCTQATAVPEGRPGTDHGALAENERLRAEVRNLEGRVAALVADKAALSAELEAARAEAASYRELAEQATAAADVRAHAAEQARLAGPRPG